MLLLFNVRTRKFNLSTSECGDPLDAGLAAHEWKSGNLRRAIDKPRCVCELARLGDDIHAHRSDSPTVLLVDSQPLVRLGLRSICESIDVGRIQILEAVSLHQGLTAYERHQERIDLVILDLNLPDSKGLLALQTFKSRFAHARVLALSSSVDTSVADEARMLGAEHVIRKTANPSEIGLTIRASLHRKSNLPVQEKTNEELACTPSRLGLSRREIQILDLVLQGQSNREIADTTQLKMGTIKNYVSGLFVVFGVGSRSKLISLFR